MGIAIGAVKVGGLAIGGVKVGGAAIGDTKVFAAAPPVMPIASFVVSPRGTGSTLVLWPNTTDARDSINPDPPVFTYNMVQYTIVEIGMAKNASRSQISIRGGDGQFGSPASTFDPLFVDFGVTGADELRFTDAVVSNVGGTGGQAGYRQYTWNHSPALSDRWRGAQMYVVRLLPV